MRFGGPLALALLAALAGCGGGSSAAPPTTTAPPAKPAGAAAVIRGWSAALRRGDVGAAARYFTLPALVENGQPAIELRSRSQVALFNKALPCGARYLRSVAHHGYTIAEFRLVNRAGPGAVRPCTGRGDKADVAFRIVGGKIREWRRAPGYPGGGGGGPAAQGDNPT